MGKLIGVRSFYFITHRIAALVLTLYRNQNKFQGKELTFTIF